jgi:SAM-dependent methyltransferase
MNSDTSVLSQLNQQTVQRYGERYARLGHHVRALGWGCEEDQAIRFGQTLRVLPQPCGTVLDIGCGFGDLLTFLTKNNAAPTNYLGWDITPGFVDASLRIHADNPTARFEVCNLMEKVAPEPVADCAVMLGLMNFNWKGQIDNVEYSKNMIRHAFSMVRDTLVFDFLSTHLTPTYPAEASVFYHNPAEMMDFAFSLTSSVTLMHDYPAIPQRECMLALRKA